MGFREILAKYADAIWMLNDEEQHRLFVSIVEYAEDGTMPEEQGNEKFVFAMMRKEMDIEFSEPKKSRSEINRENIQKRWDRKRKSNTNDTNDTNDTNCDSYKTEDTNDTKTPDSSSLNTNDTNRISYKSNCKEKESLPSPLSPSLSSPEPLSNTPPIIPKPVQEKESISPSAGESKKKSRKSIDHYGSLSAFQRERFDRFYLAYPKKETKQECAAWWNENKPDDEMLEAILHGLSEYKRTREVLKGYALDPIRFLKRRRWEDEFESSGQPFTGNTTQQRSLWETAVPFEH